MEKRGRAILTEFSLNGEKFVKLHLEILHKVSVKILCKSAIKFQLEVLEESL